MKLSAPIHYDADIIIAGAGPAGAACAFHLTRRKVRVLLLDYQQFPRDKVCGDFVGPVAIKELQQMGFDANEAFGSTNRITQAALYLDGRRRIVKTIPEVEGLPSFGRVIPRLQLDHWLVAAAGDAGAVLMENCRVTDYETFSNGVAVQVKTREGLRRLFAKALVGADGSSSTIARIVNGSKPDPKDRIVAVRAYFEGVKCVPHQAELYFTAKSFPGYYWFFPTGPTSVNVGVGMVLETFPQEEINLKKLLTDLIASDAALKEKIGDGVMQGKIVGWPLSTYNPEEPKIADRVVLAGDAGGLINSLNGEGIQYALLSGRWAAETLLSCIGQGRFDATALQAYHRTIEREVGYDMSLSNLLIQCIRNRNLNEVWLKLLNVLVDRARHDAAYADIAGGILAGLTPANKAVTLSFFSKTVLQGIYELTAGTMQAFRKGTLTQALADTAGSGFRILSDALLQAGSYTGWGKGIARDAVRLSGHIVRDAMPARADGPFNNPG